jgi:hypothetical protein
MHLAFCETWALSGNFAATLQQLYLIWSHQIQQGREQFVYGRGSPEMKFLPQDVKEDNKKFIHMLPMTIDQVGFSEIYGQNPDIDSAALMISTNAWSLNRSLKRILDLLIRLWLPLPRQNIRQIIFSACFLLLDMDIPILPCVMG